MGAGYSAAIRQYRQFLSRLKRLTLDQEFLLNDLVPDALDIYEELLSRVHYQGFVFLARLGSAILLIMVKRSRPEFAAEVCFRNGFQMAAA